MIRTAAFSLTRGRNVGANARNCRPKVRRPLRCRMNCDQGVASRAARKDRRSVVVRASGPATNRVRLERAILSQELHMLATNLLEEEQQVVTRYLSDVAVAISRYQGNDGTA
jgi:hypothetical protein